MTNNEMKKIWFDMDGTIANLYGVENWLDKILDSNAEPYAKAMPLVNMNSLARVLNRLARNGYEINIISWLAKGSNAEYDEKVILAKKNWLKKHLASVNFAKIEIVAYGTTKGENRCGILFDDEKPNRDNWKNGVAYDVNNIIEILKALK